MQRKHALIVLGAVAGAAAVVIVVMQRRHEHVRSTPDWRDPGQPVEGTGGQPAVGLPLAPSPAASWNAVRPGSPRLDAGTRIMRDYAPTLVDDPESLVR
jgi:hypothetical protein